MKAHFVPKEQLKKHTPNFAVRLKSVLKNYLIFFLHQQQCCFHKIKETEQPEQQNLLTNAKAVLQLLPAAMSSNGRTTVLLRTSGVVTLGNAPMLT
jgi:hypothetical protein